MWVHLVLGLSAAIILAIVSATGAYITFQQPLTRWLNPVPVVSRSSGTVDIARLVAVVERSFPSRTVTSIEVRESEATIVRLCDRTTVYVHPDEATIIGSRPGRFASLQNLTAVMRGLHTHLLLGARGRALVTFAAAEALLLALTGLWLWLRRKHWQFRWRRRGSIFLLSWDLHNATGIWFAAPVLVMTLTGLLLAMPDPVYRYARSAPAPWLTPPGSAPSAGGTAPIPLARAISVADSARPGLPTTLVAIPVGRAEAFALRKGGETVVIDQFNGTVITVRPDRVPTAGDHAIETIEQVHTGARLGAPGITIMTLGSVMLAMMTLTGATLGIKRLLIAIGRRSAVDP